MRERYLRALYRFLNADEDTKTIVWNMFGILNGTDAPEAEREAARLAIIAALFPSAAETEK